MSGILGISRAARQNEAGVQTDGRIVAPELAGHLLTEAEVQRKRGVRCDDFEPTPGLCGAACQKIGQILSQPAGYIGQDQIITLKAAIKCEKAEVGKVG